MTMGNRELKIVDIRPSMCKYAKNGFDFCVTDLTDYWKDLHLINIQLWFKTGIVIYYKLIESK